MYDLVMTSKASEDLDEIYRYITQELHSEIDAWTLLNKIEEKTMRLREFPFLCERVRGRFSNYRKLVIDGFVALYTVDEDEKRVIIARFFHAMQDYTDLL